MGKLRDKNDYESLRNARILENKARMMSLGVTKSAGELRVIISSAKTISTSPRKPWTKRVWDVTSLRRSDRLKGEPIPAARRSDRLKGEPIPAARQSDRLKGKPIPAPPVFDEESEAERIQYSGRRCDSRGRGSVYDPVVGICCHFCRQKKLCGEEDCRRCGERDINQPCIGKTDCSVCHSTNGIFCRACLKVRYGEELEEVMENKEWMCPHCIEEKGIRPHWICNSSICLKKRKMIPTGIAIYQARAMGHKSVAHLLMAKLKAH